MQREDSASESKTRWSDENIIELIRKTRNDFIKGLLEDRGLKAYLKSEHQLIDVSQVKLEFIKRTLKELQTSSVDLAHYGQLILAIRKSDTASFSATDKLLFYQDIEKAIKNYIS